MTIRRRVTSIHDPQKAVQLTNKEREVVELVAKGMTTQKAASELGVTLNAINSRIASLSRRLQVNHRQELIRTLYPSLYAPKSPPPAREGGTACRQSGDSAIPSSIGNPTDFLRLRVSFRGGKARVRAASVGAGLASPSSSEQTVGVPNRLSGDQFLEMGALLRKTQLDLEGQISRAKRKGLATSTSCLRTLMQCHNLVSKELAALTGEFLST